LVDFNEDSTSTGTLVTDPPTDDKFDFNAGSESAQSDATDASAEHNTVWASDDHFVFHPNLGSETGGSLNAGSIAEELQNHGNMQWEQELGALFTPEAHHDPFIHIVHHDNAVLSSGVAPTQWHAMVTGAFHLH
jgi:hypothetical protein